MSDVRPIQPPANPMRGVRGGQVGPAEATQAMATVLRYGWRKLRDHLRHSLGWIALCAYLAYGLWLKEQPSQVPAGPAVNGQNESSGVQTVMRPSLEPTTLIGHWAWIGTPHTELHFSSDGTVISRTQRKNDKGIYKVDGGRITMRFNGSPIFWDGKENLLPDGFSVSDNELTLIATIRPGDIATAQVYRFKRMEDPPSAEVDAVSSTQ